MESRKRKRDSDAPRIKYHVKQSGRSFERILKENTRGELCEVVRKKLNLDPKIPLELVQIREGVVYDLEDDEDFEAFQSAALAYSSLDVQVSYSTDALPVNSPSDQSGPSPAPSLERLTKSHGPLSVASHTATKNTTDPFSLKTGTALSSSAPVLSANEEAPQPPKKRRKTDHGDTENVHEPALPAKLKTKTKVLDPPKSTASEDEESEPPRKKQKKGKTEKETPAAANLPGPSKDGSHEIEAKSKKRVSKKVSVVTFAQDPVNADGTSKVKKSKKKPAAEEKEKSAEAPSVERRKAAKATSKPAPPPVTNGDDESPAVESVSQASHAESDAPATESVRLAYASVLSKRRPTAAELLSAYTSSNFSVEPEKEPQEEQAVKEPVAPKKNKIKTDANKKSKAESTTPNSSGRVEAGVRPGPGKSRLSESWIPGEEPAKKLPPFTPLRPSAVADSTQVSSMEIPPQPIAPTSAVSTFRQGIKKSQSPSKLSSSSKTVECPVCRTSPFHYRFMCPVFKSGAKAISARIAELEAETGKEELVSLLKIDLAKKQKQDRDSNDNVANHKALHAKDPDPPPADAVTTPLPIFPEALKKQYSPLPSWTTIVPLESRLSEVTVEGTNEGSESESSSSTGEDPQSKSDSPSEGSPSSSDTEPDSPNVNLEEVDLDALVRGPTVSFVKLLEATAEGDDEPMRHTEDEEYKDDIGVFEEEEEEPVPKRSKVVRSRSSSPEAGADDDDDRSESSVNTDMAPGRDNTLLSVGTHSSHGGQEEQHEEMGADDDGSTERQLPVHPAGQQLLEPIPTAFIEPLPIPQVSPPASVEIIKDAAAAVSATDPIIIEDAEMIPGIQAPLGNEEDSEVLPTVDKQTTSPRATAPLPPTTPRIQTVVPITPSTVQRMKDKHSNLPLSPPSHLSPSRQSLNIARPTERVTPDPPTPSIIQDKTPEKPKRGRPRTVSSPVATTKRTRSASASKEDRPPSSQPTAKLRGRPPLSEAVKAERKALRDAEKAAKAAEKRAKTSQSGKRTVSGPTNESKKPRDRDGAKSPGAASGTSGSHLVEEDDVEEIVGSPESFKKNHLRLPLFLPGASQMTQSQVVPNFPVTPWDGPVHAASPSDTEPDNDNDERPVKAPELPAPMLRPQMPAKSTFPSLSQLSFDKFRPSFLLTGRFSQSQKKDKEKEQEIIQPEDESDSEDDESSENDDRQSHIPKDKRAGVGVTKKRKPRGLLHI